MNATKNVKASKAIEIENFEGLESASIIAPMKDIVDYSNREYLEKNEPEFIEELASSKYDEIREPKIQAGLKAITYLMGDKINPLVVLLAKWWEVKPARAAIKKMLDAEAKSKAIDPDHYLQVMLRSDVDSIASIQSASDRLKYAITYFKPRPGAEKEVFNTMTIDGEYYNVSLKKLAEAKITYADDKAKLKEYLKSVSVKMDVAEIF